MTLEDGLIKTCLLPDFSALLIAFNASARTEVLVILAGVCRGYKDILQLPVALNIFKENEISPMHILFTSYTPGRDSERAVLKKKKTKKTVKKNFRFRFRSEEKKKKGNQQHFTCCRKQSGCILFFPSNPPLSYQIHIDTRAPQMLSSGERTEGIWEHAGGKWERGGIWLGGVFFFYILLEYYTLKVV